jgi:GcrA cell cycle regulator
MSASQIGDALHKTRNAIIGKLNRLGLAPKKQPPQSVERIRQARAAIPPRMKPVAVAEIDVTAITREQGKALIDLMPDDCRWPYGDSNFYFCGRPAMDGKPYCLAHGRIAHVRTPGVANVYQTNL